ncbi:hypothetical protein QYE76_014978 [Lolium multiflorum]|uniref:Uncharacterized protein n=1 Tax=Lolium multiflorum TaxID=4521 RepID=A0AAD8X6B4_LOLMU|nr:hypothetical protein QYE76_014978 [Lolium multiflorum]
MARKQRWRQLLLRPAAASFAWNSATARPPPLRFSAALSAAPPDSANARTSSLPAASALPASASSSRLRLRRGRDARSPCRLRRAITLHPRAKSAGAAHRLSADLSTPPTGGEVPERLRHVVRAAYLQARGRGGALALQAPRVHHVVRRAGSPSARRSSRRGRPCRRGSNAARRKELLAEGEAAGTAELG